MVHLGCCHKQLPNCTAPCTAPEQTYNWYPIQSCHHCYSQTPLSPSCQCSQCYCKYPHQLHPGLSVKSTPTQTPLSTPSHALQWTPSQIPKSIPMHPTYLYHSHPILSQHIFSRFIKNDTWDIGGLLDKQSKGFISISETSVFAWTRTIGWLFLKYMVRDIYDI